MNILHIQKCDIFTFIRYLCHHFVVLVVWYYKHFCIFIIFHEAFGRLNQHLEFLILLNFIQNWREYFDVDLVKMNNG